MDPVEPSKEILRFVLALFNANQILLKRFWCHKVLWYYLHVTIALVLCRPNPTILD